jgi:hypothetical protein
MNLTKTWFAAILLGGAALGAVCGNLNAQTWQAKWQPADGSTASTDWDQRVLKQAQPVQQPSVQQPSVQQSVGTYQPMGSYRMAQRPSYDRSPFGTVAMNSEPAGPMNQRKPVAGEEIVEPGTTQFEPMGQDGAMAGDCPNCGRSCGPCGACDGSPCDGCGDYGWEVFDGRCGPWLRGLSIFVGADGFKGPLDRGTNGNFGVNEGLNLARPLGDPWGCGYQIGANFVQSDFSGAPLIDDTNIRAAYRKQYFATAGIFQRAVCGGFQWGVAYDYLHDIYYQNANLQQIRSETGYVIDDCYEIGYYGAYGVGSDADRVDLNQRLKDHFKLEPTDMFVFYLRRNFENGGDGRIWGGATGNGDGLLGVDLWVPLGKGFALENRINYLIPGHGTHGTSDPGQARESWGLVAQLVWYPGQNARCQQGNPYRPMFNVADNSLFMVDRLAR